MLSDLINQHILMDVLHSVRKSQKGQDVVAVYWGIVYRDRVSNTHSCPKIGVTNFCSEDHLPRYYPGWVGKFCVWVKDKPRKTFGSSMFEGTLVNTGVGGAGDYGAPWSLTAKQMYKKNPEFYNRSIHTYGWDCRIFLDDFPQDLREDILLDIESTRIQSKLEEKTIAPLFFNMNFLWENSALQDEIVGQISEEIEV
jgi:hypothetical protein